MTTKDYVIEDSPEGRSLVVTGPWSSETAEVLRRGEVDGLVLNYARGFSEGRGLAFLDGGWRIRRLDVLDRSISDLAPIERLSVSLVELSVQAATTAQLNLGAFPWLQSVSGEWALIRDTLSAVESLRSVITWRFDEIDLHAFRDHVGLQLLTIKDAPFLESLSGVANLPELTTLRILLARCLGDISEVDRLSSSLRRFELETCPRIDVIDDVDSLTNLCFLGVNDCGEIESLAPVAGLTQLETFCAWGSTRIVDGDLSSLAALPRLREIRMRDRHGYRPRLADVQSALSA
jgi:internalin A